MSTTKTCPECGSQSPLSGKFCLNCGTELPALRQGNHPNHKACPDCGTKNEKTVNFCGNCGHKFVHKQANVQVRKKRRRSGKKQAKPARSSQSGYNHLIILLVLVGLTVVYFMTKDNSGQAVSDFVPPFQPSLEQVSDDPVLERRVLDVASNFACSCGTCDELPLESCTCETAQQERQFIRESLRKGQTTFEVIATVNSTYGWLKADSLARKTFPLVDLQSIFNEPSPPGATKASAARPAGFADRAAIISKFLCVCGQCTVPELKECTCEHPNGAKDVKQLIDESIKKGTYTVDEILKMVDTRFGGRKQ